MFLPFGINTVLDDVSNCLDSKFKFLELTIDRYSTCNFSSCNIYCHSEGNVLALPSSFGDYGDKLIQYCIRIKHIKVNCNIIISSLGIPSLESTKQCSWTVLSAIYLSQLRCIVHMNHHQLGMLGILFLGWCHHHLHL